MQGVTFTLFNAYDVFNVLVNPIEEGQMHHMDE